MFGLTNLYDKQHNIIYELTAIKYVYLCCPHLIFRRRLSKKYNYRKHGGTDLLGLNTTTKL